MADLSSLGLSKDEEKVYKALLVSGQLNRGEIAVTSKIGMSDVQTALESLLGKKLVREIPGLQGRYAYLLPLGNVKTELESSVTQIGTLGKELTQASADTINQIQKNLDDANKAIKDNVDAKSSDIKAKIAGLRESLNTEVAGQRTSVDNAVTNVSGNIASSNTAFQSSTTEKVDGFTNSSSAKIDAHSVSLNSALEQLKSDSEAVLQQARSVIPTEKIAEFSEQKQSSNVGLDDIGQKYDLAANDVEINLVQSVSKIEEAAKKSITDIDSFAYQYNESNKAANEVLTSQLALQTETTKGIISEASSSAGETKDNLGLQLESFESNFSAKNEKGTQDMDNFERQFLTFIDENQTKMSDTGKNMHAEVGHLIQTVDASYSGVVKDLKTDLEGQIDSDLTGLSATFDLHFKKMMEEVKLKIDEFKLKLNQNVDAKIGELNSKKKTMKDDLEGNVKSSGDTFESEVQATATTQRSSGEELFGNVKSNFSDFTNSSSAMVKEISNEIQNLSVNISRYLDQVNSALEEANSANAAKIAQNTETISGNYNKLVSEHFAGQKATLVTDVAKLNELVSEQIKHSKQSMNELVTNMKSQMDSKITELESSFANIQDVIAQNAESAINEIGQKYNSKFSETYTQASSLNDQNKQELTQISSELKSIVENTTQGLVQHFNQQLETMKSSFSGVIDAFESQSSQNLEITESSTNEIMNQITEVSQQGGDTTVKLVSDTVDTYKAKFEESSSLIVEKTLALTQVIDNLFKYQEASETPTLNTTHIIGKDAILLEMRDLIDRVKSKVTILVPDKKMIDVDQIHGMKRVIQVTIISHIDEVADKDWIDKMHSATANVTLRSIQKSVGGGELPDFIGCEREGEEILLGTVDDAQNDYVAIASNSEYFVQILGNIVIADYARGKSKQIKKN